MGSLPGACPGTCSWQKVWTKGQDLALLVSSKSCKGSWLFQWEMWVNKIHQAINTLIHFSHPDRMHFSDIPLSVYGWIRLASLCKFYTVLCGIRMSIHARAVISHSPSVLLKLQKCQAYTSWQNSKLVLSYVLFPQAFVVQTMQQVQLGHTRELKNMNADTNLPPCNGYVLLKC